MLDETILNCGCFFTPATMPRGWRRRSGAAEATDRMLAGQQPARTVLAIEPSSHLFIHWVDLGKFQGGNEGANEARSGQVDAFCKGATEHGETNAASIQCEPRQKRFPLGLVNAPALPPRRDVGKTHPELVLCLFEVVEAAEETIYGPATMLAMAPLITKVDSAG